MQVFKEDACIFSYLWKGAYERRLMKQAHVTIFLLIFFVNMRAGDYAAL